MAKLPARQKVSVLVFTRAGPDEILLVPRGAKHMMDWALPSVEATSPAREAALRLASLVVDAPAIADLAISTSASYTVKAGPHAGEWTERFHAVEVPVGANALEGRWFLHYEAKAEAGAGAPRVRDAITKLREVARLKP